MDTFLVDSVVIKLGQDACLVYCSDEFEYGSSLATVVIQISWKLVCKFVLMISRSNSNMGHQGCKTRSHCPNIEKPCGPNIEKHSSGHIILTQLFLNLVRMLV
jgi:hypothetical protein